MTSSPEPRLFTEPAVLVVLHAIWREQDGWTLSVGSVAADESPAMPDATRAHPGVLYERLTFLELVDVADVEVAKRRGF